MLPCSTWVLTEGYAGLQSQALGLAEAAGLVPELRVVRPRFPWRHIAPAWWPAPLRAVAPLAPPLPELAIGAGGKAAAVLAALPRGARRVVVQHPRMDPGRFDLIVAARHDGLTGPNVLVTRTALHRVTPARLAAAAAEWAPRLAHLPRPLVAVLLGGANGRYRLDRAVAGGLAAQLAGMMQADRVGLALTPSRRTAPEVTKLLAEQLAPRGAYVWDGGGANPYFGLLALADAIVVTADSVSMISEAVATRAPVLLARLPGHSRRQARFLQDLIDAGRVRPFAGRFASWPVVPLDDTAAAAAEMCRRLGL
jgi:mitochondrial fission protein ELM1